MIVIKIPQPDAEGRLVVVPPESCAPVREVNTGALLGLSIRTSVARDATPEDLGRAGWVPERDDTRAGLREALRALGRIAREAGPYRDLLGSASYHARHARTEPRATDQELFDLGERVRLDTPADPAMSDPEEGLRCAAYLAVAARVRKEQCLVAQAVGTNVDIRVCEDDGGGFMVGVHESGCDEELARCVPAAEVPATLASLLGEVSRGEELAKPEDVRLCDVLDALDGRAVIFDGLGARVGHLRVGHLLDEMDEWIGRAGEAERMVEAARRSLSSVAESMTEHAYQELASALDSPPRIAGKTAGFDQPGREHTAGDALGLRRDR